MQSETPNPGPSGPRTPYPVNDPGFADPGCCIRAGLHSIAPAAGYPAGNLKQAMPVGSATPRSSDGRQRPRVDGFLGGRRVVSFGWKSAPSDAIPPANLIFPFEAREPPFHEGARIKPLEAREPTRLSIRFLGKFFVGPSFFQFNASALFDARMCTKLSAHESRATPRRTNTIHESKSSSLATPLPFA
jgi:hypothetical protein